MSSGYIETEIKLPVRDLASVQRTVPTLGFQLKKERTLEVNILLDTGELSLRARGELLRLRTCGSSVVLTYKGRGALGKHKVREELEVELGDSMMATEILERLGYLPSFRYEKYRTEFSDGRGILTIDETPIGNYLELEGEGEWIDERAVALGYSEDDYITKSYGRLYVESCERAGRPVGNLVFSESPEST